MVQTASRPQSITYERPWLYRAQERAIFHPARYVVIEASTKSGKTVGCMAWLLEMAVLYGAVGRAFWWVAPVYAQAEIAYQRMKRGLPRGLYRANDSKLRLRLLNGAEIWFRSAEIPDNLYGEDVWAAVMDEATRASEAAFIAVRSTLTATQGPLRIIGNVKGRKNWAYRMARRAESGDQDMHYARLTAWDAVEGGVLSRDEVEDARRLLPELAFVELYLAEAAEDGSNPFGLQAIDACLTDAVTGAPPIAAGWDLARSIDWTVGIGLDAMGYVSWIERWQESAMPPGMTGDYWPATVRQIQQTTGYVPALVDATGAGDPIMQSLNTAGHTNFFPFVFSRRSKQQLIEGLSLAIQSRSVHFPEGVIADELRQLEYEHTRTGIRYAAPEGLHDDAVMALALAVAMATDPSFDEIVTLDDDDWVSIGPSV